MKPLSSYETEELIEAVRCILGKKPLPEEPPLTCNGKRMATLVTLVTLDGEREMTGNEWAALLQISRQAVWVRLTKIAERVRSGERDPYAGMTEVGRAQRLVQRKRGAAALR